MAIKHNQSKIGTVIHVLKQGPITRTRIADIFNMTENQLACTLHDIQTRIGHTVVRTDHPTRARTYHIKPDEKPWRAIHTSVGSKILDGEGATVCSISSADRDKAKLIVECINKHNYACEQGDPT